MAQKSEGKYLNSNKRYKKKVNHPESLLYNTDTTKIYQYNVSAYIYDVLRYG